MVFIWKGNKPQAQVGYNDDLVMAFAIAMWVRDTALMLRQKGVELTKSTLNNIRKNNGPGVYTSKNKLDVNPWTQRVNNQDQDITWLL